MSGAGISTCYPSATTSVLTLGPDLPWADEPSPGNLGLSTAMFLAWLSLLIPALSLLYSPLLLSVQLQSVHDAPLPLPVTISKSLDVVLYLSKGTSAGLRPGMTEIVAGNPPLRCCVLAPDIFGAQPLDQ